VHFDDRDFFRLVHLKVCGTRCLDGVRCVAIKFIVVMDCFGRLDGLGCGARFG